MPQASFAKSPKNVGGVYGCTSPLNVHPIHRCSVAMRGCLHHQASKGIKLLLSLPPGPDGTCGRGRRNGATPGPSKAPRPEAADARTAAPRLTRARTAPARRSPAAAWCSAAGPTAAARAPPAARPSSAPQRAGLDPTVVLPATKSIPGGFSSGSRQGTGRTFDQWLVLSKVSAPRHGVLRV